MAEKIRDWNRIKNSELVKKSKRGFFQVIFGRSFIIGLLFYFQLLFMLWLGSLVTSYLYLTTGAVFVVSLLVIIEIINSNENIGFSLTWAIIIGLVPTFGIALYAMMHLDYNKRIEKRYISRIVTESMDLVSVQKPVMERLKKENPHMYGISEYTRKNGGYCAYTNTSVDYYHIGEDMIDALEGELKKAEKYIFLEYFIIQKGEVWERILKVLIEKAQSGVEVRIIYDGTLDVSALPHSYPQQLQAVGIKCKMFLPQPVLFSFSYNNRDHRKIAVIDGRCAFTGGVNLADEYANISSRFGHWKDVGVKLEGDAVYGFILMFLQMWNSMEAEIVYQPYLQLPKVNHPEERGFVIPYGDSPLDNEPVGRNIYLDIINSAIDYVYIMSPYLILDPETESALKFACARGVDVRIILPHVPDKKYAFALAVAHYSLLTEAGVKIYEYTPGFVHAKLFVSDDRKCAVGTINMDYRSLYHHFECGIYAEDIPAVADMKEDFLKTQENCQFVSYQMANKIHPVYWGFGRILRVIAPLF